MTFLAPTDAGAYAGAQGQFEVTVLSNGSLAVSGAIAECRKCVARHADGTTLPSM